MLSAALDAQELAVHDKFFALSNKLDSRAAALSDEILLICVDADSALQARLLEQKRTCREKSMLNC